MSPRRNRLSKITRLREEELDQHAARLARAREAETVAAERTEAEARAEESAARARAHLAAAAVDNGSWREANEWLESRSLFHEAARHCLRRSREAAQRAHEQVMAARAALRRLQVLDQRLERAERLEESRKENKLHDELAAVQLGYRTRERG